MSETTEALIERVLGEHLWDDAPDWNCTCTWSTSWTDPAAPSRTEQWTAHVAAAIAEALAERDTCNICGKPATTLDGMVGALLCDDTTCLDAAWDLAHVPDRARPIAEETR